MMGNIEMLGRHFPWEGLDAAEGLDIECSMQMDFDLRPPDKTALACAAFPGIPHVTGSYWPVIYMLYVCWYVISNSGMIAL